MWISRMAYVELEMEEETLIMQLNCFEDGFFILIYYFGLR
jgi:hypothetical protein